LWNIIFFLGHDRLTSVLLLSASWDCCFPKRVAC
jgi:hypothetical protein